MIVSTIGVIDLVSLIVLPIILPALIGLVSRNTTWPTLGKRLALGGLTLVATVLTDVVQAITTAAPYDIGWGVAQFVATWLLAELAYRGLLKAPIAPAPEPLVIQTYSDAAIDPVHVDEAQLAKWKKDDIIKLAVSQAEVMNGQAQVIAEAPTSVTVEAPVEPKSIASILAGKH